MGVGATWYGLVWAMRNVEYSKCEYRRVGDAEKRTLRGEYPRVSTHETQISIPVTLKIPSLLNDLAQPISCLWGNSSNKQGGLSVNAVR